MAGQRQGVAVEAEEQLLCGGGGFMVRSWRLEVEDRQGRAGGPGGVFIIFFSWRGRIRTHDIVCRFVPGDPGRETDRRNPCWVNLGWEF
jgi:hypothetical protein